MRRLPSFHSLRAFEAAARHGSFVRASEELHLTASAISHQVRSLEAYFGRPLFAPGSRAKVLTEDGARLSAGLAHAFDAIETACAEVAPKATGSTLTVHCAPSFAAKWLGPRLAGFMERHPSIAIRLSSGAGSYDLLRNEATDVAIVYGEAPVGAGLSVDDLGEEEVTALCAPALATRFPDLGRRTMLQLPLIESLVSPIRWSDWFTANGLGRHPQGPMTGFDRGALVISAAVQGMGVALETERFVEAELAAGQLVRLGGGRFRPIRCVLHRLLSRTGPHAPPRVRAFRSWLLAEVGESSRDPARGPAR
ncbi:MAG: LysR substrate-binding domain-containing protein [Acetobacteraceae bacterium]|nr:LysR substrate-binding domain-containing protein [Acetobacteraceae bacterium]